MPGWYCAVSVQRVAERGKASGEVMVLPLTMASPTWTAKIPSDASGGRIEKEAHNRSTSLPGTTPGTASGETQLSLKGWGCYEGAVFDFLHSCSLTRLRARASARIRKVVDEGTNLRSWSVSEKCFVIERLCLSRKPKSFNGPDRRAPDSGWRAVQSISMTIARGDGKPRLKEEKPILGIACCQAWVRPPRRDILSSFEYQ